MTNYGYNPAIPNHALCGACGKTYGEHMGHFCDTNGPTQTYPRLFTPDPNQPIAVPSTGAQGAQPAPSAPTYPVPGAVTVTRPGIPMQDICQCCGHTYAFHFGDYCDYDVSTGSVTSGRLFTSPAGQAAGVPANPAGSPLGSTHGANVAQGANPSPIITRGPRGTLGTPANPIKVASPKVDDSNAPSVVVSAYTTTFAAIVQSEHFNVLVVDVPSTGLGCVMNSGDIYIEPYTGTVYMNKDSDDWEGGQTVELEFAIGVPVNVGPDGEAFVRDCKGVEHKMSFYDTDDNYFGYHQLVKP